LFGSFVQKQPFQSWILPEEELMKIGHCECNTCIITSDTTVDVSDVIHVISDIIHRSYHTSHVSLPDIIICYHNIYSTYPEGMNNCLLGQKASHHSRGGSGHSSFSLLIYFLKFTLIYNYIHMH